MEQKARLLHHGQNTKLIQYGTITLIPERLERSDGDRRVEELGLERAPVSLITKEVNANPDLFEMLKYEPVQAAEIGLKGPEASADPSSFVLFIGAGNAVQTVEPDHQEPAHQRVPRIYPGNLPVIVSANYQNHEYRLEITATSIESRCWVACITKEAEGPIPIDSVLRS
ncbi:MAG: hypothetical protein ABR981_01030 [Candidatus Micrarchaeaceae archaeon]|jgi:hypothetical protein